jgi:protein gp37
MSGDTKIEWATKVWNFLRGCSKVSEGCRNCYAIKQANRFAGERMPYEGLVKKTNGVLNWTGEVQRAPQVLKDPLSWKKHERIFMNSMSDMFHESVEDWVIDEAFGIVLACYVLENRQSHTFMSLTKRPERQRKYFSADPKELIKRWSESMDGVVILDDPDVLFSEYVASFDTKNLFPLPNYWAGVSVEDQETADKRVPEILQVPASIIFLSMEPLLGPVDLSKWLLTHGWAPSYYDPDNIHGHPNSEPTNEHIQWIVAGGESGSNARPMHPDWVRSIRDQCQAAGVAFHFKQYGEWAPGSNFSDHIPSGKSFDFGEGLDDNHSVWRVGKKKAGRLLDGRTWDEFPEVNL